MTWLRRLWRYYKGRLWCLTMHAPVIRQLPGFGWRDQWGRYRGSAYHEMWCVVCNNRWEQAERGEPNKAAMTWHDRRSEKRGRR